MCDEDARRNLQAVLRLCELVRDEPDTVPYVVGYLTAAKSTDQLESLLNEALERLELARGD